MELNHKVLNERLCLVDTAAALIDYIYRTQGSESRRLDYEAAAISLNVSRRTIGRYVDVLADNKLIVLNGEHNEGEVQLSNDILVKGCRDMDGCKYCKMNANYEEYCALTGELTKGAIMCDFEYEDCPEYKKALEPIKPQRKEEPQLIQTSVFGAAGEQPFKG